MHSGNAFFWQKYNQCGTVVIVGDTMIEDGSERPWHSYSPSVVAELTFSWAGLSRTVERQVLGPRLFPWLPMDRLWLLTCIVPKTLHTVFFGRLILIQTRKLVRLTHARSSVFCSPTHLGCGCLLHIWLLAKADTVLLGLWPRGTHICALSYRIMIRVCMHSATLKEHFPWTPTITALLTSHLEIYADKMEDVTLVGVSVLLSHHSWLYLGEMASARLLFCKVRTSQRRLHRESALNLCDDLSCLVQHLSTRFSKHNCQVVMILIPLLLLNLLCGKEELFLLLIYFFSVAVWTKVFLRENKELTENALHMVLYHCLV